MLGGTNSIVFGGDRPQNGTEPVTFFRGTILAWGNNSHSGVISSNVGGRPRNAPLTPGVRTARDKSVCVVMALILQQVVQTCVDYTILFLFSFNDGGNFYTSQRFIKQE